MFLMQKSFEEAVGHEAAIAIVIAVIAVAGYLIHRFIRKK